MWCRDPLLTEMRRLGFAPVRLPRSNIEPLDLLFDADGELEAAGRIDELFSSTQPLPTVGSETALPDIRGKSTGRLRVGLAISLVSSFLDTLTPGAGAKVRAASTNEKLLSFRFDHPTQTSIDLIALDRYLTAADVQGGARHITRLLDASRIYVVVAVLKSSSLTIESHRDETSAFSGGTSGVSAQGGRAGAAGLTETYRGERALVVGVKAVQLVYSEGVYRRFKPSMDVMRGGADSELLLPDRLLTL